MPLSEQFRSSFKGLLSFLAISLLIVLAVLANPGKGHHGKPTPTPSPTVTPAPSPSPSSTPTPLPPPPSVTLAWDAPADPTVTGYVLWMGFSTGGEAQGPDVGNVLSTSVQLTSGTVYFFYVTSYNSAHQMSVPSNEISYTAP